ncbi:MAG: glycosyltransferase family 2 protein [Anaerorhabdus sp.]
MAKVVVIVPIYNVEKYLKSCFDSLLSQTFKDFEIYAVNDGSPYGEEPIILDYCKKDSRIKYIKKENGGYGSVLELAISKSDAPYFIVCDPDDYLKEDALEILVDLADKTDSDICVGAKYYVYDGSDQKDFDPSYNVKFTTLKKEVVYHKNEEAFDNLFYLDVSPHTKLYKKEVAKDIKFPKKVSFTDNVLFYLSLLNSNKVIYCDRAIAYYLIDRPGNSTTDVSKKVISQNVEVIKSVLKQAANLKDVSSFFYYRMFESYKYIIQQLRRVKEDDLDKEISDIYSLLCELKKNRTEILKHYEKENIYGKIEQFKDKYILSDKIFNKFIFNREMKKIIKENKSGK